MGNPGSATDNNGSCFQVVLGTCIPHAFWPSVMFHRIFGVFLVSIEFLIPFLILTLCYGRILWMLSRRMNFNLDNRSSQSETFQVARRNTIKTFLLVGVFFVICWSSSKIYYLMYSFGFKPNWDGTFYKFAVIMAFGNCTINPFIYLMKYKDYQKALKSCLMCCHRDGNKTTNQKPSNISSSGTTLNSTT